MKVTLPGGELTIEWREKDDHVLMTGPVQFEFEGKFHAKLFEKCVRPNNRSFRFRRGVYHRAALCADPLAAPGMTAGECRCICPSTSSLSAAA